MVVIALKPNHKFFAVCMTLAMVLVALLPHLTAVWASPDEVKLMTPFPRIGIKQGQEIRLEIIVSNLGPQYQTLGLSISKPENWAATLRSGGYEIKMVSLAPNENRSVELTVSPPLKENVGSYTIRIQASDGAGNVKDSLDIIIDISEVSPLGILLTTPNPSMEGPAGQDFSFTINLVNETGEDRDINFSATYPVDWSVSFKPRWETTLIRSAYLKAGESSSFQVTVSPPKNAEAGEYRIVVEASSGTYRQELNLTVIITGTYRLSLSTSNELLNLNAYQGEKASVSLVVKNDGTAPLNDITFSSSKPSGWEVTFEPNEISTVSPGASREVSVGIKPPSDAIPGDYSVTIWAYGQPQATSASISLRVTVLGSIAWGLVGLFIIVLIVAGLFVLFWRLGRR
jgi:uncharacterized membrane protein